MRVSSEIQLMRRMRLSCAVTILTLSACSANGHGAPLSIPQTGVAPLDHGSANVAATLDDAKPSTSTASLVAVFTANYPKAARSASVAFKVSAQSVTHLVNLPQNCGSASTCKVTVAAPVGQNEQVKVLLYASTDGKGTALAFASSTATFLAGQTTTLDLPLSGIMARYTVTLTPATVTVGQAATVNVVENAFDASGNRLASGYVTTDLVKPRFFLHVTDAAGFSGPDYSGLGSGPIRYAVQVSGYPSVTVSLGFKAATPLKTGFAAVPSEDVGNPEAVLVYPSSATTPARTYILDAYEEDPEEPRYDAEGVLWLPTNGGGRTLFRIGVKQNGEWAGTLPLPGRLLAFDQNDKLYVSDPTQNGVDVYSGKTLVREIYTAGPPFAAAVDSASHLYVATGSGVSEYGPSGNGDVTPIAVNTTAAYTVQTDGAGNVYARVAGDVIGFWKAGTFGPAAPVKIYGPDISLADFGVDAAGGVYAIPGYANPSNFVYYASAGSSTFEALPVGKNVVIRDSEIAVPIK